MFFPLHFSFESASFQIKAPEPDQRFFLLIRIIHLTNGFPLLLLFFYFYFLLNLIHYALILTKISQNLPFHRTQVHSHWFVLSDNHCRDWLMFCRFDCYQNSLPLSAEFLSSPLWTRFHFLLQFLTFSPDKSAHFFPGYIFRGQLLPLSPTSQFLPRQALHLAIL